MSVFDDFFSRIKYAGDGKLKSGREKLDQWEPDSNLGKVARVTGIAGIDLSWFLFCVGKYGLDTVFMDNRIIEKLKDKKEKQEIDTNATSFKKFFQQLQKKHPVTAARLQLWMIYALFTGMVVGGVKVSQHSQEINRAIKEWMQNKNNKNTFADYKEILRPITPWLVSQLIAAEGVNLNTDGMHCPYKDGNGIWTIGFGNTRLKDGSPVTANTPPITTQEAYELARWHLEEHETFFDLYCYSVADKKLTVRNTGEAFGLSSIIYNSGTKFIEQEKDANHQARFKELRQEYKKYGAAIPDSVILSAFQKYPIVNKAAFGKSWIDSHDPQDMARAIGLYMADGGGMHWRRWMEAGLFTGDIDPQDLLECPIKGMYDFYLYMGGYKVYKSTGKESKDYIKQKTMELRKQALWEKTENGWVPRKSTYTAFKEWLKNPKTRERGSGKEFAVTRKKVKDFLPLSVLQECASGKCEIGAVLPKNDEMEKETYVIGYEDFYKDAIEKYNRGDYNRALEILENLVRENPNNAQLHNDLALIYNKIGEYNRAIEHAKIIVSRIGDKSQYAAAQYNAGVAYENIGELEKALKNYKLSFANGNAAAKNAIKRVNKKIEQAKSKITAFNSGIKKIQQKSNVLNNKDFDYSV